MKKYRFIIWRMLFLPLQACDDLFEYSPYVIDFDEHETNLTQKNISLLLANEVPDTLTIALAGDSHRFYDESEEVVSTINNHYDIDFFIHTGDIADFGIPRQYQWGDYNFSFVYGRYKFVFMNTNSREYAFNGEVPDIGWFENEISPSEDFEKAVVVFHTPPFDNDFDSELEEPFVDILTRFDNVLFATHGHLHGFNFSYPYVDEIPFVNTPSPEKKQFVIIKIFNHEFTVDPIGF